MICQSLYSSLSLPAFWCGLGQDIAQKSWDYSVGMLVPDGQSALCMVAPVSDDDMMMMTSSVKSLKKTRFLAS